MFSKFQNTFWIHTSLPKNAFQYAYRGEAKERKVRVSNWFHAHHALLVDLALLHRAVGHHRPHAGHVIIALPLVALRVILLDTGQITDPCLLVERPLKRGKRVELLHANMPRLLLRLALFLLLRGRLVFVVDADSDHRLAGIRVLRSLEQTALKYCALLFQQRQLPPYFPDRGFRYTRLWLGFRVQFRFLNRLARGWSRGLLLRPFWNCVRKRRAAPRFRSRWLLPGICACTRQRIPGSFDDFRMGFGVE